MSNYIVFAVLVAAAAFPGAARAECYLENVASPQEIDGGWTIHEDLRIVKQVDSAPYQQGGGGNWFVDRETTTLPMCSVFDDLGGYSLRSYMLQPIVTRSQVKICRATPDGGSVPFVPADAKRRPADTAHEVYPSYDRPYAGSCPPVPPTLLPLVLVGRGQAPRPAGRFTIAVNTSTIEAAPVYVAEARSAGAGINVINGGVRNLSDPVVQAATNSETQMLLATTGNPRIRMLFTLAEGHYRIIGRTSAGISSLEDLRGKRITTAPQTSAHYYLFKMLGSAGVQESDVTLVNVERTDMAQAIVRRDADAISMWEPEAQKALDGLGRDAKVFENVPLYREWFSLYTSTDVLNDAARRRDLITFVRTLLAATDTVRNRPQDAIPIVARKINQTEATVRSAWAHHAFPAALPAGILDVLTEEDQWVAKLQQRAPRTRTELARFIDTTVLAEAQQPVGRTP